MTDLKKLVLQVSVLGFLVFCLPRLAYAVYDPLSVPNNRVGVHILDPQEIHTAATLVNANGGQWGYVTIPIRTDDRDRAKWKQFFDKCLELKVIPILRLTTYVENGFWAAPTAYDLIDFANFLSELPWPIKNRYIIVFNEPNHSKEWGGNVNPGEYAALLVQAREIFKARSNDYFIITAGLDMSAPQNHTSNDGFRFYDTMTKTVPNWINAVDGLGFHAYPNPGFTAPVLSTSRFGPKSYEFELAYLKNQLKISRVSSLPIFITETGSLGSAPFFTPAFNQVWNQPSIVAITPFLLFAGSPDFSGFSLLDSSHQPTAKYYELLNLPKIKGSPLLAISPPVSMTSSYSQPPTTTQYQPSVWERITRFFSRNKPRLQIGSANILIELADTPAKRQRGLSYRSSLPENQGMLFVFDKPTTEPFWMNEMLFALDIIWIFEGKILATHESVPPPSETNNTPVVVSPPAAVNWVLEVPAGFVKQHNLKIGDQVQLL